MLETLAGIWLFLLTAGVGFLLGRYGKRTVKCQQKNKAPANTAREFGWQELLNFLQYDGSGKQPFERRDVTSETENHTDAGRAGVRSRRSV